MVGNKTLVLVVAVLAVGLFVLPSALSLFAGQHTFAEPEYIQCSKCHGAEYAELSAGGPHSTYTCGLCHQNAGVGMGYETGYDSSVQHAAISPPCVACHDLVPAELTNADESHTEFFYGALDDNSTILTDANEACVACHTMIGVNITWIRAATLTFTADHDPATGWTIGDFFAEGTNTTTTSYP